MEGRKSFVLAAGIPQMAPLGLQVWEHTMLGLGHASPKLPTLVRLIDTVWRFCKSSEMIDQITLQSRNLILHIPGTQGTCVCTTRR